MILLIDDEKRLLTQYKRLLELLGHQVLAVSSGAEGVEVFRESHEEIALVILDLVMPEMDGAETFTELQKISSSVKVLVCSGYSVEGAANDLLERGCQGFIQKPFTLGVLSSKLEKILKQGV